MKTRTALVVLTVCCLGVALPGACGAKPAGEGAFLIESTATVHDLVAQVEDSRLVALRYAKHFRTDPSSILTYFRNELSIIKLTAAADLRVYHLDESKSIVSMMKEFKAGTRVFANRSGVPILQLGTGNPLASTLPLPGSVQRLASTAAGTPAGDGKVVVQVLAQPPTEMPAGTAPGLDAPTVRTLPEPGTVVATNPGLSPEGGAGVHTAAGSSLPSWLLPVGIAGAAAALGGGGGGGTGNDAGPVAPTNDVIEPVSPVPEPSGLLALGTGIVALCGCIHRRRTRS